MKKLSIIIVTYNSEKYIYDCLNSIFKHNDLDYELEIIIVDNNSSSFGSMRQKIEENYEFDIKFIHNKQNSGYGQGNNIGVNYATSDIIMIMNPDVTVKQPFFKKTIETLSEDNVVMCGYMSFEDENTPNVAFQYLPSITISDNLRLRKRKIKIGYLQDYMFLSGACFSIRKSVFESIGGFDPNIFMYFEESDLNYRIRQANGNFTIKFLPDFGYIHQQAKDSETSKIFYRRYYKSLGYVLKKHNKSRILHIINDFIKIHILLIISLFKYTRNAIPIYDRSMRRFYYMVKFIFK